MTHLAEAERKTVADLVAILLTHPQDAEVWIARGDAPFAEFVRFSPDPDRPDAAYLLVETLPAADPRARMPPVCLHGLPLGAECLACDPGNGCATRLCDGVPIGKNHYSGSRFCKACIDGMNPESRAARITLDAP